MRGFASRARTKGNLPEARARRCQSLPVHIAARMMIGSGMPTKSIRTRSARLLSLDFPDDAGFRDEEV